MEMVKYCAANHCPIDKYACENAAKGGHLEILKYLREEVKAPWDSRIAERAAEQGDLHILKYLVKRKFFVARKRDYDGFDGRYVCWLAAKNGHLDCLKFLHKVAKAPWDSRAVEIAFKENESECLHYLLNNGCPLPEGWRYEDGTLSKYLILKQF